MNSTGNIQDAVLAQIAAQTKDWDLAARNYAGLRSVKKRTFRMDEGTEICVQFNPERIYSSSAKVDKESVSQRQCFLCIPHLPKEQVWTNYTDSYLLLVNPYPIFERHLTISHRTHTAQSIGGRMADILMLARDLDQFTLFYNGAGYGASAPDHFHFQAGSKGLMPIEIEYGVWPSTIVRHSGSCKAGTMDDYLRKCFFIRGKDMSLICEWFYKLLHLLQKMFPGYDEPMINVLAMWEDGEWVVFVFPRKIHRPWQYFAQGEEQILLSPASVDLGGALIIPREQDFEKITQSLIQDIFNQVTIDNADFKRLTEQFAGG